MSTTKIELRHCVYCRAADRECEVAGITIGRGDICGEQVRCETCGASGPVAGTSEEATTAWNNHTALVVQAVENAKNLDALIPMTEQWKQRALASAAFADDLATLMTEVTDKIRTDAPAIAARHRSALGDVDEEKET
ncbi:hypothetical protein LCGC14_0813730 [marine sediment metagenome]|uniref:Uncharacterized protein n=1 Tax=marine sediment metagenome TaxID=412755 RepID=A0A0F9S5V2_9ZZZZ